MSQGSTDRGKRAGHHRVASLDLLRGAAAFSVAIPHFLLMGRADPRLENVSVLAVEIFFVLSGFVLAPQILSVLRSGSGMALWIFLVRRWMRTVPPYLAALVTVTALVGGAAVLDVARYAVYAQNLWDQHNVSDYFPVAWSLSVEEWFYLTFPGVMMLVALSFPRKARSAAVFALLYAVGFIATVTAARTLLGDYDDWGADVRRVVLFRVDSIAYGFLAYLVLHRLSKVRAGAGLRILALLVSLALVAVTAAGAYAITAGIAETGESPLEHLFPFAAAAFGISAIALFRSVEPVFKAIPPLSRLAIFLGQISYSIYLFHLVFATLIRTNLPDPDPIAQLGLFLAVSVGFSAVFYRYFEAPILAARPVYRPKAKADQPVGGALETSS